MSHRDYNSTIQVWGKYVNEALDFSKLSGGDDDDIDKSLLHLHIILC